MLAELVPVTDSRGTNKPAIPACRRLTHSLSRGGDSGFNCLR